MIYIAKMVLIGEEFDDRWKTRKRGKKYEWLDADDQLIPLRAQLKNQALSFANQTTGGWVKLSKMSFLVYARDVLDGEGKFKFDKGDKIVRMRDVDMVTNIPLKLFVRDILYRAPYTRFNFVTLKCEKEAPQLV